MDPTTYRFLTDEDVAEGGRLLVSEFDVSGPFNRLNLDNPATIMTSTSTSISSSLNHQHTSSSTSKENSSLDEFLHICEMISKSNSTNISTTNNLSFKEELCHYMSTAGPSSSFREYWCQNEIILPKLSQFVKLYNCISATSVSSESAFSIAGYYQRKVRSSLSSTALRHSMILRQ